MPVVFRSRLFSNCVVSASPSGTMDQTLMLDYVERIIKPDLKDGRRSLLILDEHRSHYTDKVNDCFTSALIDPILIPGGYTSALQPLDVSINKPLKEAYRVLWRKWFMDPNMKVMTAGGNRQKPGYDMVVDWIGQCFSSINRASMVQRAFTCCGLSHRQSTSANGLEFIGLLNPRIKKLLFSQGCCYEREMKACYLMTFGFSSCSDLMLEINNYISIYKPIFESAAYTKEIGEEETPEETMIIEFESALDDEPNNSISSAQIRRIPQNNFSIDFLLT